MDNKSKKYRINTRDLAYGFITSVFGAMVMALHQLFASNLPFRFDWATFEPIINVGIVAGAAYLIKNFFSNSNGDFAKSEALGPGGGSNPTTGTDGLPNK